MIMKIKVLRDILESNENCSNEIKETLKEKNIYMMNIMGSPGAGKTSLIIEIIKALRDRYNIAVIEGDIAGKIDAEKIDELQIPVVQLNTKGACYIEGVYIKEAIEYFDLDNIDIIFIENIGNLVCPAEFNLGEDLKVTLLSIPEGDDKCEKYPLIFSKTDALILSKYDMIKYFNFDDKRVRNSLEALNRNIQIFNVSTVEKSEFKGLLNYLEDNIKNKISK